MRELVECVGNNRRAIRRDVMTVSFWIVMMAATAMAQQGVDTTTEVVITRRDLNGRDAVSERVVTHRSRIKDDERVLIEVYSPSMQADRLALSKRVRRQTRATDDGNQTVEETEELNPASPSEPLRVVQRTVTTVRTTGTDSYVSDRQVFEADVNGRLVLVRNVREQKSRD